MATGQPKTRPGSYDLSIGDQQVSFWYDVNMNFHELTQEIRAKLQLKSPVIVGVSGFGGSGKTYLAARLCHEFNNIDAQVVHLDNIFAEDHTNKQIFEDYDWPVIISILNEARMNKRLSYEGRGFQGEPILINQPMPDVLVVEGVRLFSSESISYFDISVWIDASLDFATKRGEDRDRQDGNDEQHIGRWANEWVPKDEKYFEEYDPKGLASILYTDYK